MAGDVTAGREDDRPGDVGLLPPQLAVHEIGEPSEEQAERHAAGDIIVDSKPVEAVLAGQPQDSEAGPDDAAMERHAAVPQLEDLNGVQPIIFGPVEEHIAQSPAEDDPERRVEHQVVGVAAGHRRAGAVDQLQQIPPADQDSGEVSEGIPAQAERADREDDRMDVEIGPVDGVGGIDCRREQSCHDLGLPPEASPPHRRGARIR